MWWQVPKLWQGERVFILGGGHSLMSHDLSLLHKERVIGVNHAFRLGQWVDICFFGDKGWYKLNEKDLSLYGGLIVCCVAVNNSEERRILHLKRNKMKGIEHRKNDCAAWNSNSGFCAINLAYHLGAKEIILLGFDMQSESKETTHWHDHYKKATYAKDYKDPYKRFLSYAKTIKQDADRIGLKIINATPGGMLEEFDRKPFEEIVQ